MAPDPPSNPSPTTPLPTGNNASPAAPIAVPAAAGGGAPSTATTPPPGFPPWLLQSDAGAYVEYSAARKGITSKTADKTQVTSPAHLYRIQFLFGIQQDSTSYVNAILYLLLVDAQKQLWNNMLTALGNALAGGTPPASTPTPPPPSSGSGSAAPDPPPPASAPSGGTDPSDSNWYSQVLAQRNIDLLQGHLIPMDAGAEPEPAATSAPVTPKIINQLQSNNINAGGVAAYVTSKAVSVQDQRKLLAEYCGTTESTGGMHGNGTSEQHTFGGAIDIEYSRSHYIPMLSLGGATLADSGSYHGFGVTDPTTKTTSPKATEVVFTPCLHAYDNACNAIANKPNPARVGGGDLALPRSDPTLPVNPSPQITSRFGDLMTLHNSMVAYFSQPGHDDDNNAARLGAIKGNAKYDPATQTVVARGANDHFWTPKNGIIGFKEPIVQALCAAQSPDLSGMSYRIRWSMFTWGADLMHFDIEHGPLGQFKDLGAAGCTVPILDDVETAEAVVDNYLSVGQSDGKNPWGSPASPKPGS
jgi:hypothetical protein